MLGLLKVVKAIDFRQAIVDKGKITYLNTKNIKK